MKLRCLLLLLGMLPFLAWGAEVGPTRAKTMVEPSRPLLLRMYNGERGTLLIKNARITVAEPGKPDQVACAETVMVLLSVRRGESREMELLPLDKLQECLSQSGYRVPPGARPVEAAETPVCSTCVPADNGGEAAVAVPFSVRLEMSCPGILQEYWTFTNYLFFQYPPKGRPILIRPQ